MRAFASKTSTFFLLATLCLAGLSGCGSAERNLCERAAECSYIGDSDIDECTGDLQRSIDDSDIEKKQVRECLRCSYDNDCGIDIALDCATECEGITGIIVGANIH